MKRTKILLFAIALLVVSLSLSACAKKEQVDMNELSADNMYHYENSTLGFKIDLPPEFIYYQTQRKNASGYSDLEILVPTADPDFVGSIANYATPVVVRVYDKDAWEGSVNDNSDVADGFKKVDESKNGVITVRFADNMPADWSGKWTQDLKDSIKDSIANL